MGLLSLLGLMGSPLGGLARRPGMTPPFVQPTQPEGQGAGPAMFPAQQPQQPQMKPPAAPQNFSQRLDGLFNSPMLQMGMSLMGNAQNGGDWGAVGRDLAAYNQQRLQNQRLKNDDRRLASADKRQQQQFGWQQRDYEQEQQRRTAHAQAVQNEQDPVRRQQLLAIGPDGYAQSVNNAENRAFQTEQAQLDRENQLRAAGISAGRANADDARQDRRFGSQLRNQFLSRNENFVARRDAYTQLRRLETGGRDSDIAFIYTYMKALDPVSAVREGEFATAQNSAGVPESIRNQYNRILNGRTSLSAATREGMVQTARTIYDSAAEQFERDRNLQLQMGEQMGGGEYMEGDFIAPDLRLPPEAAPPPADSRAGAGRVGAGGGQRDFDALPDPRGYSEGQTITDHVTGQTRIKRNGQWQIVPDMTRRPDGPMRRG